MIEVTVKVPKALLTFLKDMEPIIEESPTQYLEYCIKQQVISHFECAEVFVMTKKFASEKYGLTDYLNDD